MLFKKQKMIKSKLNKENKKQDAFVNWK